MCWFEMTLILINLLPISLQDGKGKRIALSKRGFKYVAPTGFSSLAFSTELGTYDGGGYVVSLKDTHKYALEMIRSLKAKNWITKYTRALFLECTIYNVNSNLFTNIKALFEFSEVGGISYRTYIESFRPYPYVSTWDFMLLVLQLLWVCVTIYMFIKFIIKLRRNKRNVVGTFWICLEGMILFLNTSAVVTYICRIAAVINAVETIKNNEGEYLIINFENRQ